MSPQTMNSEFRRSTARVVFGAQLSAKRKAREGRREVERVERKVEVDFLFSVMSHFDQTDTSEYLSWWKSMWLNILAGSRRRRIGEQSRLLPSAWEFFFRSKLESETGSSQR